MYHRYFLALILAAASPLSAAVAASAAKGHENHKGHGNDPARAALAELGALAVFDAKGTLWAAYKAAGAVVVSRSDDLGKSWSKPVRVTAEPEPTDTGLDSRPKIAVGRGEVYVTWTRPMSKPYAGEIRFARSLDEGRTFLPAITVHADRQEITHRFDSIVVNREGQIFVAWIDKRDLVAAAEKKDGPAYRGAAVYYAVSDNRGESFRGDFKVADHSCECCRISLVARNDGTVVALWRHIFAPNVRDHAFAELRGDGKSGPVHRASIDDWGIDVCPHHGPSVAIDAQGGLHSVWFTGSAKNPGVYYGRLNEKGVAAQCRVGGEAAERGDLAASGRRVAVAWKEFDGERSQLLGMISEDGGATWKQCRLGSTNGASDHPRVVTHNDRFYVFWNTRNEPLSVTPFP